VGLDNRVQPHIVKINTDHCIFVKIAILDCYHNLIHAFGRITKRAGIEDVYFHDLRPVFAYLILPRRHKPKVISKALGYSSVAFTMDVYSHIIEHMQEDAMVLLDNVLPAGIFPKKITTSS